MSSPTDDLTSELLSALGAMPVRLVYLNGHWYVPMFGPGGDPLNELKERGLIEYVAGSSPFYRRTLLGEATWERR